MPAFLQVQVIKSFSHRVTFHLWSCSYPNTEPRVWGTTLEKLTMLHTGNIGNFSNFKSPERTVDVKPLKGKVEVRKLKGIQTVLWICSTSVWLTVFWLTNQSGLIFVNRVNINSLTGSQRHRISINAPVSDKTDEHMCCCRVTVWRCIFFHMKQKRADSILMCGDHCPIKEFTLGKKIQIPLKLSWQI